MLHIGTKKEALRIHEAAVKKYNDTYSQVANNCEALYLRRKTAVEAIQNVEVLINSIANSPKEFSVTSANIAAERMQFHETEEYVRDAYKSAIKSEVSAGTLVAGGTALAALGPSAAMWVATTFGTASTGTAISTLHGVVATKAALAWLGGGALSAGGGGIVAGKALLALAGPIGWSIAGTAVTVSSIFVARKNKEVAEKAMEEAKKITIAGAELAEANAIIRHIQEETDLLTKKLVDYYDKCMSMENADYSILTDDERLSLGALVNNTYALATLLNKTV